MTKEIRKATPGGRKPAEIAAAARGFVTRAVPKGTDAGHLHLAVDMALRSTPALAECDLPSLYAAIYQIAALGLLPGGPLGLAYLIPYGKTCQLIVGYRGMIQLAVGSGAAISIRAGVVAQGDDLEWCEGLKPTLIHRPRSSAPPADTITHAYAIADLPGGGQQWAVLTRDDLEARRKPGKGRSSPWDTHYHEMARKSAVRALCKYLPLSPDRALKLHRAEAAEAGVIDDATAQALADAGFVAEDVIEAEEVVT